jgi:ribosomal protein S18 acetylase RimI-like enzyme
LVERNNISLLNHAESAVSNAMHGVFQRSYRREAALLSVQDFPPLKRTAKDLSETDRSFFGLWVNGSLAGVLEVDLTDDCLEIFSLVVDPPFFRRGVASGLINHALASFDCKYAVVETAAENQPAITLYEKHGFAEEKKWLPSHGIPKIRLRAKLTL